MLILSELAGAALELTDALIINPTDTQEVANAIERGLNMPPEEQERRMKYMRQHLQNHNVFRWSNDFLTAFSETMINQPDIETDLPVPSFINTFADARQRLLLFDFDGTLAPIVNNPADAEPTADMITALRHLAEGSDLVIISGRSRRVSGEDLLRAFPFGWWPNTARL